MRTILVAFVMMAATLAATPASSQWTPPGPFTFVRGETYDLAFAQPALNDFLAADIFVRYSTDVFEPILLLPGSLASMLSIPVPVPVSLGGGLEEALISIIPSGTPPPGDFGIDLPDGTMFGVRIRVKDDAPLGVASPSTDFTFVFGDPAHIDVTKEIEISDSVLIVSNVVAVPEPATWALMLSGFGLVCAWAARRRRMVATA